jgi:hypothetical protein
MDPTPTPDPVTGDLGNLLSSVSLIAVVIAVIFVALTVTLFGAMLMRAARYPWPVPILAPLSMLTLVFGLAGAYTQSLVPLAGAGMGALAGVVTSQLGKGQRVPPPPDEGSEDGPGPGGQ